MNPTDLFERLGFPGAASLACSAALGAALVTAATTGNARLAPGLLLLALGFFSFAWAEWERLRPKANLKAASAGARKLRLRLMWKHQFQFIGIYRAKQQLEENNSSGKGPLLDVREGGSPLGLDPRATVSGGLEELGITSATALIRWFFQHRSAEDANRLVPLLVVFRRSPACLIYRAQDSQTTITVADLAGKRFRVPDREDPATMEFHALCERSGVRDVQLDLPFEVEDMEEDPTSNLQNGGSANYRLGYSFNEGYRSARLRSQIQEYRYELLAKVFSKAALYADVLFTRRELLDDKETREDIQNIVNTIQDSYAYFVDSTKSEYEQVESVNKYMEAYCVDWWHNLIGSRPYDATARELIKLLADAWATRDSAPLGSRDLWRELEEGILSEKKEPIESLPHLHHLTSFECTSRWFS